MWGGHDVGGDLVKACCEKVVRWEWISVPCFLDCVDMLFVYGRVGESFDMGINVSKNFDKTKIMNVNPLNSYSRADIK